MHKLLENRSFITYTSDMKILCLLSLYVFAFTSVGIVLCSAQTLNHISLTVDGRQRDCIVVVPSSHTSATIQPLLMDFHGFGTSAEHQLNRTGFFQLAEQHDVVVAFPQGVQIGGNTHWNVGGFTQGSPVDDVAFVRALIDTLKANYTIDSNRIYASGMSNGGFMALRLACELSDKIAAVASVAGGMAPEILEVCAPRRPVAVLQIHGTSDEVIPYNGTIWSEPISDVVDFWVSNNTCFSTPTTEEIPDVDVLDTVHAHIELYRDCDSGTAVTHIVVEGGGHSWPGQYVGRPGVCNDFDASEVILEFLLQHSLTEPYPTAVDDHAEHAPDDVKLTLLPNPASEIVEVRGATTGDVLRVVDVNGRVVAKSEISSSAHVVSLRTLGAGMYWVLTGSGAVPLTIHK